MNKLLKRSLAFIGGGAMLLNLIFPCTEVFAGSDVSCEDVHNFEVTVNDKEVKCYTSLVDAIGETSDGTITLMGDVSESAEVEIDGGKNIIFDLGDNTYTLTNKIVLKNGNLTIKNGSIIGNNWAMKIMTRNHKESELYNHLVIEEDATIGDENTSRSVVLFQAGAGDDLHKGYGSLIDIHGTLGGNLRVMGNIQEGDSTINIDGTIHSPKEGVSVAGQGTSTINIQDGAVIEGKTAIEIARATLNVEGGTITATGTPTTEEFNNNGTTINGAAIAISPYTKSANVEVNINGGEITAQEEGSVLIISNAHSNNSKPEGEEKWNLEEANNISLSIPETSEATFSGPLRLVKKYVDIKGGVFTSNPTNYIAEGYQSNEVEGKYIVSELPTVATIGDTGYKSLKGAIDAAQEGDTIKILNDIILDASIQVEKKIILDLNGKTISVNKDLIIIKDDAPYLVEFPNDYVFAVKRGGDLTIDGNGTIDGTDLVVGIKITVTGEARDDAAYTAQTAKLTVKNGTIKGGDFGISGNGTRHNTELNVKEGTIIGGTAGIYHPQDGIFSIEGGYIEGNDTAMEIRSGSGTISGGEFVSKATPASSEGNGNGTTTKGAAVGIAQHTTVKAIKLAIEGGIFNGYSSIYQSDPNNKSASRNDSKSVITTINGGTFNGIVVDKNPGEYEKLVINGGIFKEDPTEYVAENKMVGQSEAEYIVGTTAELKDVKSDANYIAAPTTKVAFGGSSFDDTTLSSGSVEIEVAENTGSAINNNDKPADGDMKVNEGNTPTVEGQVAITFSGHENEVAKFKTPILIRIPIISNKLKARVMVKHAGSGFNYKGLTKNLESEITCDEDGDVPEANAYSGEEVDVVEGYALVRTCSASIFVAYTESVKVTPSSSSGRTSGGGSSSTTTKKDDKKDDTQVIELKGEVTEESTTTGEVKEENTKSDVIISDAAKAAYNDEQLAAYQWAYDNGITTINDADKARLSDPLTRAELAKMMSQYISSVLKKSPIKADKPGYKDVDESLGDLADYIVKAYQYQIMGIDADGNALEYFNPNGLVTRAEYATVFSRVLYGSANNQKDGPYYEKHLAALKEAGILTEDDPTIQEVRGWVMLMMYRSVNPKAPTQEETKAEEGTGNNVGIANPASTYCVEQEGKIEIREDAEGAQYGVCKFKDGTEVEEWEYFRANHKDETTTGAVAESSTGSVAETTTGTVAENATGAVATTGAAENN